MPVRVKRAYKPPAEGDGYRVLVDHVWPRAITKDDLLIDAWRKDLAPSTDLRKWFGPERCDEFRKRYAKELEQRTDALGKLVERARAGPVTLVYGARDSERNNAVLLKERLERWLQR